MRNYKKTGWVEEIESRLDEKSSKGLYYTGCVFLLFGCLGLTSFKEHKTADNPREEISKTPVLKKEIF
ncbi:hypothetical protein [Chryseobacterium sp. MYb328]|uniref:hypothetical protein n=1 Tax=Chryseobacterium sp. MYb328 TaxID=2745231 RepID=UPI00309BCBFF